MSVISVDHLNKIFHARQPTAKTPFSAFKFWDRKTIPVSAVHDISFEIQKGERVAFVGPNGAGKSTTLKILTGILSPSSGKAHVLGLVPADNRKKLGYQIGTLFGQRSQLWQHLPAQDTFDLLAKIYNQDVAVYKKRSTELVEAFDLGRLVHKPVSRLSLGERMKFELIASLLHHPQVLFLDEPTIGLDVTAKAMIRDLIKQRSEEDNVTLLLTSHDTGDIENVCDRIIIMNHGTILADQSLKSLREKYIKSKRITLVSEKAFLDISLPGIQKISQEPHRLVLEINTSVTSVSEVISYALKASSLHDMTVEDPPMEEIIKEIYRDAKSKQTH